jgi:hypothetical protein
LDEIMNRRSNGRIEMKLPCMLTFPTEWNAAVPGITANMHRDGLLISCDPLSLHGEMPKPGAKGKVQVELPPNPAFSRKCVVCETTLVRIKDGAAGETQFAMRIGSVVFRDLSPETVNFMALQNTPASLPV